MQLPYRPKYLQRARRTAFVSAPEPAIAPSAFHADDSRVYTPGPVLTYSAERGVVLFRDGPPASWRHEPIEPPKTSLKRLPVWVMLLQAAILLAAIFAGSIVHAPGAGQ